MHHISTKHSEFWSQKGISGGLNSPDEVMGEMVSETKLSQTACSYIQNKANKQRNVKGKHALTEVDATC